MERIKRALSLVLCFVMVFGLMPASIFAAEGDAHYLMFATDRHANTSVIGEIINNMESDIGENKLEYLALGGDMVGSGNTHPEYDSSEVLSEVTGATSSLSAANVDIVAGIHDMKVNDDAGIVLPYQGGGAQIYEGNDYYVYGVEEYCISEDSNESNWSAQAQAFVTWANGETIDKSKVIFISSHYPLHAFRDDNDGAYYWHKALNTVATGGDSTVERDIVFFHGHNHTKDSNEYVYNVGDTMSIQNGSSTVSDTIYYTYATAGYLNQNSKATLVTLTDDTIVLTKYSTSGSGSAMTTVKRVVQEAAPTVNTVSDTADNGDEITAVGTGLTGVTLTVNENADTSAFQSDCVAYDVALEGYTEGDTVTLTFNIGYMTSENLVVYANGTEITPVSVVDNEEEDGFYSVLVTVETTSATGTYVIGKLGAAEGATMTSIEVTAMPTTTNYTLVLDEADDGNIYLDITGLVISAVYDDGSKFPVEWNEFDETIDGYALSFDITEAGVRTVTVTYGGFETSFDVTVYEPNAVDADVSEAVADVLKDGYIAKEFNPTGYAEGTEIRVVMPAPEGANVVYHVADDNTLTRIENVTFDNGYVIFDTDHFSSYVVGESTEIEVPEPETATGSGETTTTTKKTVYVLTSSISSGNEYLIVNSNSAGSRYALANNSGSVAATGVTVKSGDVDGDGDNETYIELDDAADELWTVGGSYTFQNNGSYLGYTSSGSNWNTTYTFGLSSTARTWSYSNNRLSIKPGNTTYYLRYNSGWTWTNSSNASGRSIYFYIPTEVEVKTTTTASGTYFIAGNPAEVTKVVANGSTVELGSTLTFQPESGSATTTENPTGVTYTVVANGDPNGVISGINGNTVTFSGAYGKALVKVSYETSFGPVTNYIVVNASEPTYVLDITSGGDVVTGTTVAQKGVTASTTLQLGTQIQFVDEDGEEIVELPEGATLTWTIPEEYHSIATVDQNGLVSFKGVDGAFYVTATLTVGDKNYTVGVNISATTSQYSTPTDGTDDFPEYPNEGAIRFDKTGTAVGNFSETGIAQIELSMTGVPYTTGSEIDVVVMLDMSTSMDDDRIAATVAATKVFVESIVKNTDGSYNSNRIYVGYFNGDTVYTITGTDNIGGELATVDNDTEYDALIAAIEDEYDGALTASGTNYDVSLEECYNVLTAAKKDGIGNDRDQFVLFMSDGGPTDYATSASNVVSESTVVDWFDVSASDSANWTNSVVEEYWSGLMKDNGVTIYSVGLILQEKPTSGPSDYRSYSADQNYYVTSTLLTGIASGADYFINCESATDTADMEDVFSNIAAKILQAATDITVEDKITDEYTMIFDIPTGTTGITGVTNDFYIEFGKYALDEEHERTEDGYTSVTKLYLENTNGVLSAKDTTAPVFEQKTIGDKGTLYYWSTNASDGDTGISITVDGATYYFVSYGLEEAGYNMTSGAYAHGTVDSTTNMSENLVIATPYFVYNAGTKMLYWTVDKLDTYEYTLRYFLYLNNSATEVATDKEADPGPYPTNDHAYITYTNFNGNDCRQVFPVPQLTWNGAQVSYVFYLVNAAGQPINKSGQVVDFANATFITDVYTEAVVWNKAGETSTGTGELSANWLADDLLPDEYEIYDKQARYVLNVYENADGTTIKNQFTISGDTAANISSSLNTRLNLDTTANTVSVSTTKVYNTKAGEKISAYGTYTSADDNMKGFDFANTTVAFAVVWQPRLVPDVVVVDYGLDVLINVVQNDILQNKVTGIGLGNSAYGDIAMNTGVSTESKLGTAALTIEGNTISLENETSVRFHQDDMEFNKTVEFYYETPVEFWEGSAPTEGYMYSSVTVIPATTVYYEDDFIQFSSYSKVDGTFVEDETTQWATQAQSGVQDQDRPGESKISAALDADNNYGYDSAYESMSTFSMGSAAKITVDANTRGEATFTFYGTGFDVISMTSNTSGTILVQITDQTGTTVKNAVVDTYYGYTYENGEWVTTNDADNALYQIPVIKFFDLPYGQYTAKIMAVYNDVFNHTATEGEYDLYLDAIRIYDPTGNQDDTSNEAYVADGEAYPEYFEVRDQIITKETFDSLNNDAVTGIVYIDGGIAEPSIADYTSYGPNNEVYLESGDAIAFDLNATAVTDTAVAKVQLALKTVGGNASVKVYAADGTTALDADISTATDMYYDITELNGKTVVIMNDGDSGIVSITNVKVTYTAEQTEATEPAAAMFMLRRSSVDAALATMSVEEDIPEETIPEETIPEETVPEETVPEETVPEETTPEEPDDTTVEEVVEKVLEGIAKLIGKLFGKLFG